MKPKRIATVVLVLALALGMVAGCETFNKWIGTAVEKVCNFSVDDSKEAQTAKKFISATAGLVGLVLSTVTIRGVKIEITEAKAGAIFDSVANAAQTGGCIALQDLQAALAYFDQVTAAASQKELVVGRPMAKAAPSLLRLKMKAGMLQ